PCNVSSPKSKRKRMPWIGELSGCPQSRPPSISARTQSPLLKRSLPGKRPPPFVANTTFSVPLLSRKRPSSSNLALKSSTADIAPPPPALCQPLPILCPFVRLYQASQDHWYAGSSASPRKERPRFVAGVPLVSATRVP